MNDEILPYLWDPVLAHDSASPASRNKSAIFVYSIHPDNQPGNIKESRDEVQLSVDHIILPWPKYT